MAKSTTFSNDFLLWFFNKIDPTWLSNLNVYLALHIADPGVGGVQTTSEATYTGYTRVEVPLTDVYWVVVDNVVSNASTINFPIIEADSGDEATYISIGSDLVGDGLVFWSGAIAGDPLPLTIGNTPSFTAGELQLVED